MKDIDKIKAKFYFDKWEEPILEHYGEYRVGITDEELEDYLRARSGKVNIEKLIKKYWDVAGCNTCGLTSDSRVLHYRHDVQRYSDVLFGKIKSTYFD